MRWVKIGISAAVLLAGIPANAAPAPSADQLFYQGQFDEAQKLYEAVPQTSPSYQAALGHLGAIALYENRLDDADRLLHAGLARDPNDKTVLSLLAETANRRGKFSDAAKWLGKLGKTSRAAEFALFGNSIPYRMAAGGASVEVAFTQTDPLPIIKAKVNGHEGLFLIDTAAGEVVLDPEFAASTGIPITPSAPQATGGEKTPGFGRIAKLSISSLDIADVPAMIVSTKAFAPDVGQKKIAGVIGTELLSHFVATIDYPGGRLVLAPYDKPAEMPANTVAVPFTMIGDHFIAARGRLDAGQEQLFVLDTALAGIAFTAPGSTLDDARIPPPKSTVPGVSPASGTPFPIATLMLGDLHAQKLVGVYGPFPPPLEGILGVHIGGIVSHVFFRSYAVTFDFRKMKVLLHKPV